MNWAARLAVVAGMIAAPALANTSTRSWLAIPPSYKVFDHSNPSFPVAGGSDFQTSVLPAVRAAFDAWTRAHVACTKWDSLYGGPFSSPSGSAAINGRDGQNSVIWLGGSDWTEAPETLGLTITTYRVSTGEIIDADMQLNNNREWKVGGPDQKLDVRSIVTHEAGHFMGLDHTPDPRAIMYASYPVGSIRIVLQPPDISDACTAYPRECSAPSDCPSGYVCQVTTSPPSSTGRACLAISTSPPDAGTPPPQRPPSNGEGGCNTTSGAETWPAAAIAILELCRRGRRRFVALGTSK